MDKRSSIENALKNIGFKADHVLLKITVGDLAEDVFLVVESLGENEGLTEDQKLEFFNDNFDELYGVADRALDNGRDIREAIEVAFYDALEEMRND